MGFATHSYSLTAIALLPSLFTVLSSLFILFVCLPSGIAPNITAGPSDSTVIDGMSVILHCETSGAPRPAITWQKGLYCTHAHTPRDYDVCYLLRMGS